MPRLMLAGAHVRKCDGCGVWDVLATKRLCESCVAPSQPTYDDQPTSVYVLLDADQEVLYVGLTEAAMGRFQGHMRDKHWWPEVDYARFEHHPNRAAAVARERQLIIRLGPRYNVAHNQRTPCSNCGRRRVRSRLRCDACYTYLRRHRHERPERLWDSPQHKTRPREPVPQPADVKGDTVL